MSRTRDHQTTTLSDQVTSTKSGMRDWQQERVILDVTEAVCELMDDRGVTRAQLARRLGKTPGFVSQLLDGEANMTLRTASDLFTALDACMYVTHGPITASQQPARSFRLFMPAVFEKPSDEARSPQFRFQYD